MKTKNILLTAAACVMLPAFLLWAFRPVGGYFKPVIGYEGGIEELIYIETTWWGLANEEYPVEVKDGSAFFLKGERRVAIDEWKYFPPQR